MSGLSEDQEIFRDHIDTSLTSLYGAIKSLPLTVPRTPIPILGSAIFPSLFLQHERDDWKHLQPLLETVFESPRAVTAEMITRGPEGVEVVVKLFSRIGSDKFAQLGEESRDEVNSWIEALGGALRTRSQAPPPPIKPPRKIKKEVEASPMLVLGNGTVHSYSRGKAKQDIPTPTPVASSSRSLWAPPPPAPRSESTKRQRHAIPHDPTTSSFASTPMDIKPSATNGSSSVIPRFSSTLRRAATPPPVPVSTSPTVVPIPPTVPAREGSVDSLSSLSSLSDSDDAASRSPPTTSNKVKLRRSISTSSQTKPSKAPRISIPKSPPRISARTGRVIKKAKKFEYDSSENEEEVGALDDEVRFEIGKPVMAKLPSGGWWPAMVLDPNLSVGGKVFGKRTASSYLVKGIPEGGDWSYLPPQSLEPLPATPVIHSWLDNTLSAPPHYQTPAFKKYKADWIEAFFLISNPDRLKEWAGGMTQREREDEDRRIRKAEVEKADKLALFGSTYGYS